MQCLVLMFLHNIVNPLQFGGSERYGILMKTFFLANL